MITVLLHGLRMMADLLTYGSFASFFAACLGGQPAPLLLLLPAVCYGISACFLSRPILRTGCVVVALLGVLLVPDWVDRAAYLPAVFYPLYLVWRGEYLLSADRQADVFLMFCKAYPVFALLLGLAWNGRVMLEVSLPLAIWAVSLQIFLMRVLRQAPAVYRSPDYLLGNAGLLLGVGALSFLLSRSAVMSAIQTAVGAVYFGLVVPVLTVPLSIAAWAAEHLLLPAITALLYWIAARSGNQDPAELGSAADSALHSSNFNLSGESLLDGTWLLTAVGLVLLGIGCILLFRRLVQKSKTPLTGAGEAETQQVSRRTRRRWPSFFLSPNARVRRAYSRYLEQQARHGVARCPSETSLERLGRTPFLRPDAEQQLRQLYLKARYGECATFQDASAAERLEKMLEKPDESDGKDSSV